MILPFLCQEKVVKPTVTVYNGEKMVLKLQGVFLRSDNGRNYRDLMEKGHKIIVIFVNYCVIIASSLSTCGF